MRYDFMIVDVFTDEAFGGNQLAVLTDARGLTAEGMQIITREFNFAETTFVLPPDDPNHAAHVRIFTPGRELPFAGHPTVGTACVLAMSGVREPGALVLEEGVGPVPVVVEQKGDSYSARLRLDRGPDMPDSVPSTKEAAELLSLHPSDIADVFAASLGVNFTFVQLKDQGTVDRAKLDMDAWTRLLETAWGPAIYLFAGDLSDGSEVYARMFAPSFGIAEDPATGAAAAALIGAAGVRSGIADGEIRIDINQGVQMGRPSLIRASVTLEGGAVGSIYVGGGTAFVAQGQIEVPDRFVERG
jgi:trans-2,3-dihydro-3-hydroxyanthranilate isomerase